MSLKKAFLFIVFFGALMAAAKSETPLYINDEKEEYMIPAENLDILEDRYGKYTINEIVSGSTEVKFEKNTDPFPHVVDTKYIYWVRFSVVPQFSNSRRRWILEELDPHFTKCEFYIFQDSALISTTKTGINFPFIQREYQHKNFVVDMPFEGEKKITVYVRFEANDYNVFLFKLRTTNFFTHYALNEYYILGLYYGIIFIMALYNLLLFLTVREKVYLHYVFYVFSCALISFSEDGIGFHYVWPNLPWLNEIVDTYSSLLFLFFFTFYARSFLELNKRLPQIDKLVIIIVALSYGFYFLQGLNFFPNLWYIPVFAVPYLMITIASVLSFMDGNRSARFFILANSIILISIIILMLRMKGVVGWDNIITIYCFNIGIVFEIVILSIALGDKIRTIKSENEKAHLLVIEQLKENEKLKDKVNRELEEKVKERTYEIQHQKEIIEDQNKELSFANEKLLEQANEILRMNALLNEENKTLAVQKEELVHEKEELVHEKKELEGNVKELNKARILMKDVDFTEFSSIFPDKDVCMNYLVELKWSKGYKCIRCDNEKHFDGHEPYSRRCTKCGYDESATAYTIFHRLRFPITKAFYMLFLIYSNKGKITSLELSQIVSLRQSTCWSFRKKVIEKMDTRKKLSHAESDGWSWLVKE